MVDVARPPRRSGRAAPGRAPVSVRARRWAAALVAALGLLAAGSKPYEDTKGRFALRLPDTWKLTPRFGDLWGMTFERALDAGQSTALTVHVDPVPAIDVAGFAERAEAAWSSAGAAAPVSESRASVAGRPALVRDLDQGGRRVRAYFFESGGRYYHLRFEVAPALVRSIEPEWQAIVSSFRPGGAAPAARPSGSGASALPEGLVGTWRGKSGVVLVLKPERTFSMGGLKGRFSVDDGALTLVVPGRAPLRFEWSLDGDALRLSSAGLAEPAVYTRASADEGTLVGKWRAGSTALELARSGRFTMGAQSGSWASSEDRLTLHGERGEDVTYRYTLDGGALTLSGGDLEEPLVMERAR